MRRDNLLLALAAAAAIPFLLACGSDPIGPAPYVGTIDPPAVSFETEAFSIGLNETVDLTHCLNISKENIFVTVDDSVWESSDETKVQVFSDGSVRGVALGSATVSATVAGHVATIIVQVVSRGGKDQPPEEDTVH